MKNDEHNIFSAIKWIFNFQIPGGTTAAIAATQKVTATNERFCGRFLGSEATVTLPVSLCSKSAVFLSITVNCKINLKFYTYKSVILSILAASVPYTVGVSFDDIEYHKTVADGKADGSEQMVAPGNNLYPRLIIVLSEVYFQYLLQIVIIIN